MSRTSAFRKSATDHPDVASSTRPDPPDHPEQPARPALAVVADQLQNPNPSATRRLTSSPSRMRAEPNVPMPRTSEVLWDGRSSLPFTLKRKRTGAILVTKLKRGAPLRLGSELRLVGGFPVQTLTLAEVKKVMLHAPKPVSLVFLNHENVVLDNMSFLSDDRASFGTDDVPDEPMPETEPEPEATKEVAEPVSNSNATTISSSSEEVPDTEVPSVCGQRRRRETESPPRKVSRLRLTLDRMNELLNRPVRRSALNVTSGKCIVV